ncbi:MAG: hypothetical protein ACOX1A_07045 [Saccharofermentanales bacterium]
MKIYKSKTWQFEVSGIDGNVILFGINIFEYEWNNTGESVLVEDPIYHQKFKFPVYTVNIDGESHSFVAGEFSNCIWGFYLFKY